MTRRLGLLFTLNVSLMDWRKQGLLEREVQIYEDLLTQRVYDQIYWFTYGSEDAQHYQGLPEGVVVIPMPRLFNHAIGKLLYSFLMPFIHRARFRECAALKTNQLPGAWTAILAARLNRIPCIVRAGYIWSWTARKNRELTGRYTRKLDCLAGFVERWVYTRATLAIVTTASQKSYVESSYPAISGRVHVVPNAIETERFRPTAPAENSRLIYVGRLSEEKNVIALLDALRDVNAELDIYGEGGLRPSLESHARRLGVCVTFHGNVANSRLPELLSAHRLFVLPSLYEGLPKALLEAMACGLACIGSNVADINQIIRHGDNGWLCAPTADGLRSAIRSLLADRPLVHTLGKNARIFIESTYSRVSVSRLEAGIHRELYAAG